MNSYFGKDCITTSNNSINAGSSLAILGTGLEGLLLGERPIAAFFHRARAAREKHIDLIDYMNLQTTDERIQEIENELEQRDRPFVEELVEKIQYGPAREIVLKPLAPSWMYGISPVRWQALAYLCFIQSAKHGARFRSCDIGPWLRIDGDFDHNLWTLFQLVRYPTETVSKLLGAPDMPNFGWFLTEDENRRLPDFYRPLDAFRVALDNAGMLGPYRNFPYTRKILWDRKTNSIQSV